MNKESICNAGDTGDAGLIPRSGRFPWRRAPWRRVLLPGESQGQRSLPGYSPRSCEGLDTTEVTEHTRPHAPLVRTQRSHCESLGSMPGRGSGPSSCAGQVAKREKGNSQWLPM